MSGGASARSPKALLLLASGAEEMETVIAIDVMRRGGVEVVVAGLEGNNSVVCSRQVRLVPDMALEELHADAHEFAAVVLPGGLGGAQAMAEHPLVGSWLQAMAKDQGVVGAICAAPLALVRHGFGAGRTMTSHPSVQDEVAGHGNYSEDPVVVDRSDAEGALVTGRGPGTAFPFALRLVAELQGAEVAAELVPPMMFPEGAVPNL